MEGFLKSEGVVSSGKVNESCGVVSSNNVVRSGGVYQSHGVYVSFAVDATYGVHRSMGVENCREVIRSKGVNLCYAVTACRGVHYSDGVSESSAVSESQGVYKSSGVSYCYAIFNCHGISSSLFCCNTSGEYLIFNKQVAEHRFYEVHKKIKSFEWFPVYNNVQDVCGDSTWSDVDVSKIDSIGNKAAWSSMPEELKKYIKGLPEYDEEIFNMITGRGI